MELATSRIFGTTHGACDIPIFRDYRLPIELATSRFFRTLFPFSFSFSFSFFSPLTSHLSPLNSSFSPHHHITTLPHHHITTSTLLSHLSFLITHSSFLIPHSSPHHHINSYAACDIQFFRYCFLLLQHILDYFLLHLRNYERYVILSIAKPATYANSGKNILIKFWRRILNKKRKLKNKKNKTP